MAETRASRLAKLEGLPIILVFALLLALFMWTAPRVFLQPFIYTTFLSTLPPLILLAVGLTFVIGAGEIDLCFPAIIAFACIGCYSINLNVFDIYAIVVFGLIGYVLVKLGCEPAPLLLGFVLGPLLEEHLRRAMIISRGDPMIFLERPISATLLVLAVGAVIVAVLPSVRKKRQEVFVEDD